MTGQLCMCYNWDQTNLCYCNAAVNFYFLCVFVFVNCLLLVLLCIPKTEVLG